MHHASRVLAAASTIVLLASPCACGGGRQDASGGGAGGAPFVDAASSGTDAGEGTPDASTPVVDAAEGPECPSRATDAGLYCAPKETCVIWLAPGSSVSGQGGFGATTPDAGIVSAECSAAYPTTLCDGGTLAGVGYDVYWNQVSWVACVEP